MRNLFINYSSGQQADCLPGCPTILLHDWILYLSSSRSQLLSSFRFIPPRSRYERNAKRDHFSEFCGRSERSTDLRWNKRALNVYRMDVMRIVVAWGQGRIWIGPVQMLEGQTAWVHISLLRWKLPFQVSTLRWYRPAACRLFRQQMWGIYNHEWLYIVRVSVSSSGDPAVWRLDYHTRSLRDHRRVAAAGSKTNTADKHILHPKPAGVGLLLPAKNGGGGETLLILHCEVNWLIQPCHY